MQLTPQQNDAILHDGGNLQLIACAGSGKTEVVAQHPKLLTPSGDGCGAGVLETIKTGGAGDQAAELLAIALEKISTFEPPPGQ